MSAPSYFGRAWKLTVFPQATGETWIVSNSSWDPEALRITFAIEQVANQSYWFADIAIYNPSASTQQVIQRGDLVTLEAGYQQPGVGLLFQGRVFQPTWEREGDTDYKLTLHCMIGLFEDENGAVSVSINANASKPLTLGEGVRQVAKAGNISIEYVDPVLEQTTFPRGIVYAGPATKYFCDAATGNQLDYWMSWKGINIRSLAPQGTVPDVIYAPPIGKNAQTDIGHEGLIKYTLIGTPQQTEQGIAFRTLLDTDLQLASLVKIDQALLRKLPLYPGQKPILLDKDGIFVVAAIRYLGDSRGNDWYSEITGVTREWSKLYGVPAR